MAKIGVLGGSFHPFHNGHLFLGQYCLENNLMDEIWYIPTGCSYLKAGQKMLSGQERYDLVRAGIQDEPRMKVLDIEIRRSGNTYTYETMETLRDQYPEHEFYFIVGADCLFTIETWKCADRIFRACSLLAAKRDGQTDTAMKEKIQDLKERFGANILLLEFPEMDISSTEVRNRATKGLPINDLVPAGVMKMIEENGYFQANGEKRNSIGQE